MAFQIGHSAEHIEVHKHEVISDIEQLVATTRTAQYPSGNSHQLEECLQNQYDGVEGTCTPHHQDDVYKQEEQHGYWGDAPAEHTVTDVLEGHQRLMEGVEHGAKPPDALQTACRYTALAL